MPKKRIKIDVNTDLGDKITITLEGYLTRDKVLQILEFVDLMSGPNIQINENTITKYDRIYNLISRKFPIGWFTSQELMVAYEDVFNSPIGLSTVSTYLSRLAAKNILIKAGSIAQRKYKLIKRNLKYPVPP